MTDQEYMDSLKRIPSSKMKKLYEIDTDYKNRVITIKYTKHFFPGCFGYLSSLLDITNAADKCVNRSHLSNRDTIVGP